MVKTKNREESLKKIKSKKKRKRKAKENLDILLKTLKRVIKWGDIKKEVQEEPHRV